MVDEGEVEGLTREQADRLKVLRDYRNELAHELPRYLIDPAAVIDVRPVLAIRDIVRSLGRFWGRIEVDINPDFDNRDVSDDDIHSGSMMLFDMVLHAIVESEAVDN